MCVCVSGRTMSVAVFLKWFRPFMTGLDGSLSDSTMTSLFGDRGCLSFFKSLGEERETNYLLYKLNSTRQNVNMESKTPLE